MTEKLADTNGLKLSFQNNQNSFTFYYSKQNKHFERGCFYLTKYKLIVGNSDNPNSNSVRFYYDAHVYASQ